MTRADIGPGPNSSPAPSLWTWPGFALSAGVEECAAGVEVVLEKDGREVGRATTDTFGEFVIDRLEPNSSGYHLKAAGPAGRCSTQFDLAEESRYLGVMTLAAE